MRKGSSNNKNVENLMTVANEIKCTRLPSLWNPTHIDKGSNGVEEPHDKLEQERHNYLGLIAMKDDCMSGRDDPREAHAEEQSSPEGSIASSGERGGEQSYDYSSADEGD